LLLATGALADAAALLARVIADDRCGATVAGRRARELAARGFEQFEAAR
jgi:hypothetical protein